jgi:hypothetical protein
MHMDDQRKGYASEDEFTCDEGLNKPSDPKECYEIRCKGHLGDHWKTQFADMSMAHGEDGTTTFTGPVIDQPALFGLLDRVRDLGVALISVRMVNPKQDIHDSQE